MTDGLLTTARSVSIEPGNLGRASNASTCNTGISRDLESSGVGYLTSEPDILISKAFDFKTKDLKSDKTQWKAQGSCAHVALVGFSSNLDNYGVVQRGFVCFPKVTLTCNSFTAVQS